MPSRIHWLSLLTALLMLAGFSSPGISQEPSDETTVEAMRDRFNKSAGEFEFTVASTGEKLQRFTKQPNKILRVQTSALHRYDADHLPETIVDGALFAYVQGTDPGVVAMVEGRKNAAGEETWHIAFARMTVVSANVEYQSATAWEVEWGQRGFFSHYNVRKNTD